MNFQDRFSALIRDSPLSQKQLAAELGLAESTIVNYKSGRTPKADELLKIATHFKVTMEWLLIGDASGATQEQEQSSVVREDPVPYGAKKPPPPQQPTMAEAFQLMRQALEMLEQIIKNQPPKQ